MTNCAGFEVDVDEYLNFLLWCYDTVDSSICTSVLEKLSASILSIPKNSNICFGKQGTPKQWYVYSYVHGIMSKKPEILKWRIFLLMVNMSRKHRLSCSNCSHFDNRIVQRNNNFFTTNSQPRTIFISASKGKFTGSYCWKGLQTPIQKWECTGNAYGFGSIVQC
jgi:hypothetical protein